MSSVDFVERLISGLATREGYLTFTSPNMLVLPVELRENILQPLHLSDLTSIRAVGNHALCELTTPMVFRAIRVGNDPRGLEVFKAIAGHKNASMVQEVHVNISQPKTVTKTGAIGRWRTIYHLYILVQFSP